MARVIAFLFNRQEPGYGVFYNDSGTAADLNKLSDNSADREVIHDHGMR